MEKRSVVYDLLDQFLGVSKRIPDLAPALRDQPWAPPPPLPDFQIGPPPPAKRPSPVVPPLPGYNPYFPGRPYLFDPNEPLAPEINPYMPPWFPRVPDRRAPDRPPAEEKEIDLDRIGSAGPSIGLTSWLRESGNRLGGDADRSVTRVAGPFADPLAALAAVVRISAMRDGSG